MIQFVVRDEHDTAGVAVVEGAGGRPTAAEAPGHRAFVLARRYERAE